MFDQNFYSNTNQNETPCNLNLILKKMPDFITYKETKK